MGMAPQPHRIFGRRSTVRRSALAVVGLGIGLPAAVLSAEPAAATTHVTSCTEPAFDGAVSGGGTVVFGLNCTLTLTHSVNIAAALTVTVEAGGHSVSLSGGEAVRLFVV